MFEVALTPEAEDFFATAQRPLERKLNRCFEQLEQEPRRHSNIRRLKGSMAGLLRYRVGDWRVIYRIDDDAKMVYVIDIAHRSEVYE
ncbi:MAG: type II toxin-antitoxin system RelE family toxin [Pirellulaceae bacterium]